MLAPTSGSVLSLMNAGGGANRSAQTSFSTSTNSFSQQLANALESYLNQAPAGAPVSIDITPQTSAQQGQESGVRQFLVTLRNTALPAPAASGPAAVAPLSTSPASSPAAVNETAPPAPTYKNETEAYWATMPEAVQALRQIPTYEGRMAKAMELTRQGYSIDYELNVLLDDPWQAMSYRANAGYTWIPALGQEQIDLPPGSTFAGRKQYDPLNPPPGSIKVDLAFSKGLEHTSIWWHEVGT